jgi:hypothetical protein
MTDTGVSTATCSAHEPCGTASESVLASAFPTMVESTPAADQLHRPARDPAQRSILTELNGRSLPERP